ncbi:MAG: UDP-glucose 4-epimerase GalE [Gammaproteobacteria bacterium RIFCSPHIGHO2_12_FULL_41_20]|nr:MAG: UDP-glucose 4-epimerase GalE [Gammaproteobacteria bacterium RIFCSPHIGHO2_12_FULL_41_20]
MHTKFILVVGGAGYIGSHMLLALRAAGFQPIVLDNLSKGCRDAVLDALLVEGDIADEALLNKVFSTYHFAAVMHFASFIEVGESVRLPLKYYENNMAASLTLLKVMLQHNVKNFVFSSTAAVYGEPKYIPIDEAHPVQPINPYGKSKWMLEQVLQDLSSSHGLRFAALRYFNAAGADPQGRLAERHHPETHLIPLILQAARDERAAITIYGKDYPTADGTCIRDYIHVTDLCEAHLLALRALLEGASSMTYNLGTGRGYSVEQVIQVARVVTQCVISVEVGARRAGDPISLIANAARAQRELHWQPCYPELETIVRHAWAASTKIMQEV